MQNTASNDISKHMDETPVMPADAKPVHTTPGPWDVSGSIIQGSANEAVALVLWPKADGTIHSGAQDMNRRAPAIDEHEANARLIAAAPYMLRSLLDIVDCEEGEGDKMQIIARSAITEARYLKGAAPSASARQVLDNPSPRQVLDSLQMDLAIATAKQLDSTNGARDGRRAIIEWLKANPPRSYRLQEAYDNGDGTFSAPHWDEVYDFATGNGIDREEAIDHILNEGSWTEMFLNPQDDHRPGCRRVIEVSW